MICILSRFINVHTEMWIREIAICWNGGFLVEAADNPSSDKGRDRKGEMVFSAANLFRFWFLKLGTFGSLISNLTYTDFGSNIA